MPFHLVQGSRVLGVNGMDAGGPGQQQAGHHGVVLFAQQPLKSDCRLDDRQRRSLIAGRNRFRRIAQALQLLPNLVEVQVVPFFRDFRQ